ncbi:GCN5 family acetyltransferase [Pontibacter korlensis]|uniref:GCN5 family acetyltransferase n=2 Tax=Pontibacter korlensis TaxID=400092 RepID=A0A0E3ZIT6_9BACT|nr:GCN5 family acetyltransferase [Pontibacter korlensis]
MIYRRATAADIEGMFRVRFAVQENKLSDPSLVTHEICRQMIEERGAGWVCEVGGEAVGFAIVDLSKANIWALFIEPAYERKGIGRKLHDEMVAWAFGKGLRKLWLGTDPGTRAEGFYRKAGWRAIGKEANGEIKFELEKHNFTPVQEPG